MIKIQFLYYSYNDISPSRGAFNSHSVIVKTPAFFPVINYNYIGII